MEGFDDVVDVVVLGGIDGIAGRESVKRDVLLRV